ncbi:putative multi-domain containing protein [Aduncisulcus paluster]|uniref:60S ribosomal protein L18a n=1 Tax=Aduncisulcus paluster TaxID=2918883 RepID=A0ABQ5KQK2_9EUKA|nr:putative multi-domain containing protein [Aduncisulcus paluster]
MLHQFVICGRKVPTGTEATQIYKMRIFAYNEVQAKSRFWYFLKKLRKVKRTAAEILDVKEIKDKKRTSARNYGLWIRFQSRSGVLNMYREYRDVTMTGAVAQMYGEMAGQHSARFDTIQIVDVKEIAAKECKREKVTAYHDSKLAFPLLRGSKVVRNNKYRGTFSAKRPNLF